MRRFYADDDGPARACRRASTFRLLLIGYFEGLDSERGIAWRAADSLALRDFLGLASGRGAAGPLDDFADASADSISKRTARSSPGCCSGWRRPAWSRARRSAIDATTLEANAALRSIVRRDTGESYQEFLTKLAQASGIETPTRADLARLDRKRKKKGSNDDWTHPHDPDAKITKMKDGRTHLAHKAEHAVDLETGAIVGVTVQGADQGDTTTIDRDVDGSGRAARGGRPQATGEPIAIIDEVVADKGYHSEPGARDLDDARASHLHQRARSRPPQRGSNKHAERDAVYANRRRIRGARGQRLLRQRGERWSGRLRISTKPAACGGRTCAGTTNILKRLLVHAGAFNLGLWMRHAVRRRHAARPAGPRGGARRDDHGIVRVH